MTIEKKSLIKSLKTTKKANVAASAPVTKEVTTRKNAMATRKNYARLRMAAKTP